MWLVILVVVVWISAAAVVGLGLALDREHTPEMSREKTPKNKPLGRIVAII